MIEIISAFDAQVLHFLYATRDPALVQALIWITELGSTAVVGGIALCVGLILALRSRFAYFMGLAVCIAGSAATVFVLKELIHRARPDKVFQAYLETGFSFPSGHAAMSLALYGFMTWLAWRLIPSKRWRWAVLTIAIALVGTIGFSRMYLGIHYASDVAGGFLIGATFVGLGALAAQKMQTLLTDPSKQS